MSAAVTDEIWLALLVLIVPACWLAWKWLRATMSTPRVVSVAVFRSLLIASIAAMLAGLSSVRETDRLTVVLAVDGSQSVRTFAFESGELGTDAQGRNLAWDARVRDMIEGVSTDLGPDDLVGVVVFDGRSLAVSAPSRRVLDNPPLGVSDVDGTDIEAAIRLAARLVPPDSAGRIVLVSDGVETGGDAVAAAREVVGAAEAAGAGSIRVDVVPITYAVENEVMIDAVDAPPNAVEGSRVTLRVALRSTDQATGTIEVEYEGRRIDVNGTAPGTGRRVALAPGRTVVPIEIDLVEGQPLHRFIPTFVPDDDSMDGVRDNNRAETFTYTAGTASVLIVDGRDPLTVGTGGVALTDAQMEANPLRVALEASDIEAASVTPEELPVSLLGLQGYDLVILQDVGAADVPRDAHALLSDYVSTLGGGLVMVGGPDSFGAGGWKGTDLEDILPVQLDLPDEVIEPQAAIAFVLDKSGSMSSRVGGSKTQQEIANEGAAYAILTLDPSDLLMVVAFDSGPSTVVEMGPVGEPRVKAERVRSISANGGTNLMPAMRRAGQALLREDARVKHMVILSDGQSSGDSNEMITFAQELQQQGISVSAIAVGDGADRETLFRIATGGGGNFYPVTDPTVLPQVFVRDTQFVRRPLIRLKPFLPVVTGPSSPVIAGSPSWREGAQVPPLDGLVLTQAREDVRVTNALASDDGYPLLSHWFVGRGQVAAFTSDADLWARAWATSGTWDGYRSMWTQIARNIARSSVDPNAELVTSVEGGDLVIDYASFDDDGAPIDGLRVEGFVQGPEGGEPQRIRLAQTGPGRYGLRVPATARGNYVVALDPSRGAKKLAPVVGGASRALGPEYAALRSDPDLLLRVAEVGAGNVWRLEQVGAPQSAGGVNLFDREGVTPSRSMTPLWPILLAWTIAVFVLDVATRRVAWDRLLNRELMAEWKQAVREAAEGRGQAAVATVGGLRMKAQATRSGATAPGAARPGKPAQSDPSPVDTGERMADVMARQRDRRDKLRSAGAPGPAEAPANQPGARPQPQKQAPGQAPRRDQKPAPKQAPKKQPKADQPPEEPKSTTEGLLAAKRRARERGGG